MQYKILASDYDNTLVPFGEKQPRPAMNRQRTVSWVRQEGCISYQERNYFSDTSV